jgi:hypothetical protein
MLFLAQHMHIFILFLLLASFSRQLEKKATNEEKETTIFVLFLSHGKSDFFLSFFFG